MKSPVYYRTNPRYTELFFPASFGLKPLNFRLTKAKPAGTIRIFVLGESAAMGVPEPGFGLAPQLGAQLRAAYPDRKIDVYNLGVTAINSHVIRHIVRQAVRFQPDLLVIYMGNNEVIGPYGPGSAISETMLPLPLIRASIWLRSSRTGQLLERALHGLGRTGGGFKEWRGMEMFASKALRADDPRMEAVYGNFARNLTDILDAARAAGIPTVLSTVAVNIRDCAPFVSRHRPDLSSAQLNTWQDVADEAGLADDLGETARAQALWIRAVDLDPEYAEAHYRLAQVLDQQGELEPARREYLKALHWDALHFRCDARLNQIIRRLRPRGRQFRDLGRCGPGDGLRRGLHGRARRAFVFPRARPSDLGRQRSARAIARRTGGAAAPRPPRGARALAGRVGVRPCAGVYRAWAGDHA